MMSVHINNSHVKRIVSIAKVYVLVNLLFMKIYLRVFPVLWHFEKKIHHNLPLIDLVVFYAIECAYLILWYTQGHKKPWIVIFRSDVCTEFFIKHPDELYFFF